MEVVLVFIVAVAIIGKGLFVDVVERVVHGLIGSESKVSGVQK